MKFLMVLLTLEFKILFGRIAHMCIWDFEWIFHPVEVRENLVKFLINNIRCIHHLIFASVKVKDVGLHVNDLVVALTKDKPARPTHLSCSCLKSIDRVHEGNFQFDVTFTKLVLHSWRTPTTPLYFFLSR